MARKFTRLFRPEHFFHDQTICLSLEQSHHLSRVLRLKKNDCIYVFNKVYGQWQATIIDDSKKQFVIKIDHNTRSASQEFHLKLAFTPLKSRAMDFLIEKATELGVTSFHPFWSERTQGRDFKEGRYKIMAQEAAEQSERLSVPSFDPLVSLQDFLTGWDPKQTIFIGDERRNVPSLFDYFQASIPVEKKDSTRTSMIVMIGPEGGFTEQEFNLLQNQTFCCFVSLSQTVLRSETAALCALALMQAKNYAKEN